MKLGRYGAWLNPIDDDTARTEYAAEAEALGYGTVWLGLGTRDESDLRLQDRHPDRFLLGVGGESWRRWDLGRWAWPPSARPAAIRT